jgi:hypothetical protein
MIYDPASVHCWLGWLECHSALEEVWIRSRD